MCMCVRAYVCSCVRACVRTYIHTCCNIINVDVYNLNNRREYGRNCTGAVSI